MTRGEREKKNWSLPFWRINMTKRRTRTEVAGGGGGEVRRRGARCERQESGCQHPNEKTEAEHWGATVVREWREEKS